MEEDPQETVLPLPFWIVLLIIVTCWPVVVFGEPIAVGESNGVKVTLTNEKCAMTEVSNLPYRATWEEGGKSFEGCWGANGFAVMTYWADKTVAAMPRNMFARVHGA
jgi:hypothetical protein